jgi:hypothetical protein
MIKLRKKGATKAGKLRLFGKVVQDIQTSGKFVILGLCMINLRKKEATQANMQELFGRTVLVEHPAGRTWRRSRARRTGVLRMRSTIVMS